MILYRNKYESYSKAFSLYNIEKESCVMSTEIVLPRNSGNKNILHAFVCLSNEYLSHFTYILISFNHKTSPNFNVG